MRAKASRKAPRNTQVESPRPRRVIKPRLTEDEADAIVVKRRLTEPDIPLERVLREDGFRLER